MHRQDDHHVQINDMKTTPLYRQTLHQPLLHSFKPCVHSLSIQRSLALTELVTSLLVLDYAHE